MITSRCFPLVLAVLFCVGANLAADALFHVGKFDGVPGDASRELVKSEFSLLSGSGHTIRVVKREDFPQRLEPGRRLALFLDKLTGSDDSPRTDYLLTISLSVGAEGKATTPLMIKFNECVIWNAVVGRNDKLIRAAVFAEWFGKEGNVIQIINDGNEPIAFDALSIDAVGLKTAIPENSIKTAGIRAGHSDDPSAFLERESMSIHRSLLDDIHALAPLGVKFQGKLAVLIPFKIAELLQYGRIPDFAKLAGNPELFDTLTGKPKPIPRRAVEAIAPLFAGVPSFIPMNLTPVVESEPLRAVAWGAVANSPGTITVICSSALKSEYGKRVMISISFPDEWRRASGKNVDVVVRRLSNGSNPPISKTTLTGKETSWKPRIEDGALAFETRLSDIAVFRISRKGATPPPKVKYPRSLKRGKRPLIKPGVSSERPSADPPRFPLRRSGGAVFAQNSYCSGKTVDAAEGLIDGTPNVVPWDVKSSLVSISFPKGAVFKGEMAALPFGDAPSSAVAASFWVRPKAKRKTVSFKFYFRHPERGYKPRVFETTLKTGEWLRVEVKLKHGKTPKWGDFRVLADSRSPEYKNNGKVSFEFNGFCVLQKPSPFFKSRVIEKKNPAGKVSSLTILFFGRPGKSGELRHSFKRPVSFGKMRLLGKLPAGAKPKLKYLKKAQTLQIKFTFPGGYYPIPETIRALLTKKEKRLIDERAFLCAVLRIEINN